jgi:hypothetical protein
MASICGSVCSHRIEAWSTSPPASCLCLFLPTAHAGTCYLRRHQPTDRHARAVCVPRWCSYQARQCPQPQPEQRYLLCGECLLILAAGTWVYYQMFVLVTACLACHQLLLALLVVVTALWSIPNICAFVVASPVIALVERHPSRGFSGYCFRAY